MKNYFLLSIKVLFKIYFLKKITGASFGGLVVKNLPANAEDTSSIPGLGRSHMLQGNQAHVPQLLSLHSGACELQLMKPACFMSMLHNEKSHNVRSPYATTREMDHAAAKTQHYQK